MKQTIQSSLYIFIGFVFALTITSVSAWTGNTATPPGNNAPAPLNVASNAQYKQGALSLGTASLPTTGSILDVNGTIFGKGLLINGAFQLIDGTEGEGKVLVSDAGGRATWGEGESLDGFSRVLLNAPINLYALQLGFNLSGTGPETSGTITAGVTAGLPANAKSVLLYGKIDDNSSGAIHFIQFRHPGQNNWKYLLHSLSPFYGVDNSAWIPLDSNGQLQWRVSRAYVSEGHLLEIQGYEVY